MPRFCPVRVLVQAVLAAHTPCTCYEDERAEVGLTIDGAWAPRWKTGLWKPPAAPSGLRIRIDRVRRMSMHACVHTGHESTESPNVESVTFLVASSMTVVRATLGMGRA